MGAIWNNGPIEMKFGTWVETYKSHSCAKFGCIAHKSELFIGLKAYFGGDTCMRARWNNVPIITIFNRDRPNTKIVICAQFHQDIWDIVTIPTYLMVLCVKAPFWENFCMGAIRNNGPIKMKFGTLIEIC